MAASNVREVLEGVQYQGVDEIITRTLTTTNVGSSPSSPTAVVKDVTAGGTDVTATVMPAGAHTVSGDVITLKPMGYLTAGRRYRVEVKYTVAGNTVENYFYVQAQE